MNKIILFLLVCLTTVLFSQETPHVRYKDLNDACKTSISAYVITQDGTVTGTWVLSTLLTANAGIVLDDSLKTGSGDFVGLGTGKGIITFTDATIDTIAISGANLTNALAFTNSGLATFGGGISIGAAQEFTLTDAGLDTIATESNIILDTYGDAAADTAVTLTGVVGQVVYISTADNGRDITFLDAGNFALGAERVLTNINDVLVLKATTDTTWKEISFANNE